MITEERRIEEESLAAAQPYESDLFVVLDYQSLILSITDATNSVVALVKYISSDSPANLLEEVCLQEQLLGRKFQSVSLAIGNSAFSLVPDRLFDANADPSVYYHMLGQTNDGTVRIDNARNSEAFKTVFVVDHALSQTISNRLPSASVHHVTSVLLSVFQGIAAQQQENGVYVCVTGEAMYLACFKAGELQFFNRFIFHSARDFLYFILLIYRQFNLRPEQTPLYLSGSLLKDSSIFNLLYRYVRNVSFLSPPEGVNLLPLLSRDPGHLYFSSLSMKVCGL